MITILKAAEDKVLQLSDEDLSPGYVRITVIQGDAQVQASVLLNELMPALISFDAKHGRSSWQE